MVATFDIELLHRRCDFRNDGRLLHGIQNGVASDFQLDVGKQHGSDIDGDLRLHFGLRLRGPAPEKDGTEQDAGIKPAATSPLQTRIWSNHGFRNLPSVFATWQWPDDSAPEHHHTRCGPESAGSARRPLPEPWI